MHSINDIVFYLDRQEIKTGKVYEIFTKRKITDLSSDNTPKIKTETTYLLYDAITDINPYCTEHNQFRVITEGGMPRTFKPHELFGSIEELTQNLLQKYNEKYQ